MAFGASPLVVGLLFAAFSLCQLVAAPLLGDLSDRYGRRPVLIFSLLGTVVSFVILAVAHTVAMLFLARIVDGLSGGNISTARAYVADVTEPKDRARAYGLIGAAFGLGFIFGPALSGVLAKSNIDINDTTIVEIGGTVVLVGGIVGQVSGGGGTVVDVEVTSVELVVPGVVFVGVPEAAGRPLVHDAASAATTNAPATTHV